MNPDQIIKEIHEWNNFWIFIAIVVNLVGFLIWMGGRIAIGGLK